MVFWFQIVLNMAKERSDEFKYVVIKEVRTTGDPRVECVFCCRTFTLNKQLRDVEYEQKVIPWEVDPVSDEEL